MQTLHLISTEKKLQLMEQMLYSQENKTRVRFIAKKLGMNPGYVSVIIKKMEKEGILENGRIKNENPKIKALKIVLNIEKIAKAWQKMRKTGILGFGIFGSWSKGTNTESSDLDVWIKTKNELGVAELSRIRRILKQETGAPEISIIALTNKRIKELKNKDQLFYATLLNSFHIGGEQID